MNLTYNEIILVKYYRGTDERGKRAILNTAQSMFGNYPLNNSNDNKEQSSVLSFQNYQKIHKV